MNFKKIIGSVAPTLGTALGGPLGGMAAKFAVDKLIPGAKPKDANDAMSILENFISGASPDQIAQLKKLDHEFKVQMKELGIRESELAAKDRADARQMAVAQGILPQITFSGVYTLGYFCLVAAAFSGSIQVPDELRVEFGNAMAFLTAIQLQIMNFWFGSSSGSKEKDKA
jgi:hypothetical protein